MNPLTIIGIKIALVLTLAGGIVWAIEAIPAHYIAVGVKQANDAHAAADAKHLAADLADKATRDRQAIADRDAAQLNRIKGEYDHEKDKAAAVAAARAGNSGMRCPGATLYADTTPAASAVIARSSDTGGQQLLPAAAGDILDIAGNIAKGVRRYNALLAEDAAARAVCKSEPLPPSSP